MGFDSQDLKHFFPSGGQDDWELVSWWILDFRSMHDGGKPTQVLSAVDMSPMLLLAEISKWDWKIGADIIKQARKKACGGCQTDEAPYKW